MIPAGPYGWPVSLQHGPVGLRPLRGADERAWRDVRGRNADWTGPWDATAPPEAEDDGGTFRQMVRSFNREARAGRMLPWAITYRDGGAPAVFAGQMTIAGIVRGSARMANAGYWVDRRWAGRGVVPTALAMAGDHLFGTLLLHRLEVAIRPENTNSIRVVEKLGLRHEGLRPRFLHVDGDWRDHLIFAVHAEEVGPEGLIGRLASGPRG